MGSKLYRHGLVMAQADLSIHWAHMTEHYGNTPIQIY